MARWFGPPIGNCSCCEAGDVQYGPPWVDDGVAAFRFSNWDLIGATDSNTTNGTLYGRLVYFSDGLGGETTNVDLYRLPTRLFGSLVSYSQNLGAVFAGATLNFTAQGFDGITGTVRYDLPLLIVGSEDFTVTGTPVA